MFTNATSKKEQHTRASSRQQKYQSEKTGPLETPPDEPNRQFHAEFTKAGKYAFSKIMSEVEGERKKRARVEGGGEVVPLELGEVLCAPCSEDEQVLVGEEEPPVKRVKRAVGEEKEKEEEEEEEDEPLELLLEPPAQRWRRSAAERKLEEWKTDVERRLGVVFRDLKEETEKVMRSYGATQEFTHRILGERCTTLGEDLECKERKLRAEMATLREEVMGRVRGQDSKVTALESKLENLSRRVARQERKNKKGACSLM